VNKKGKLMKKILLLLAGLFLSGLLCSCGSDQGQPDPLGRTESVAHETAPLYVVPYSYCAQYGTWDSFGFSPYGPSSWTTWVVGSGYARIDSTSLAKYAPYAAELRSYSTGGFSVMEKQFDALNTGTLWLNTAPSCSSFVEGNTHTENSTACTVEIWVKPRLGFTTGALSLMDVNHNYLNVVPFNLSTTKYTLIESQLIPNCPQKMIARIGIDGSSWILADDIYINWFY